MRFDRYIVHPRPGGGFLLTGPLLPYPAWYRNDIDALDYAHHVGREHGGSVWLLDSRGHPIIAETIAWRGHHRLGE